MITSNIETRPDGLWLIEKSGNTIISESKYTAPVTAPRAVTKWAFRQRFTFTERCTMTASIDPGVVVIREDLLAAEEINLDDPSVALSLDYLISKGLLAPDRKAAILS